MQIDAVVLLSLLIVCSQVVIPLQAAAATDSTNAEARLHAYLFGTDSATGNAYNARLRPVRNSSSVMLVQAQIALKRLYEIDEMNQRVSLFAVLIQKWTDDYLKWKPADYGGLMFTYVSCDRVWMPRLNLISKYSDTGEAVRSPNDNSVPDNNVRYPVKLNWNGVVEFVPTMHMTSSCLFNYARFPFDTQDCQFIYQMPYDAKQVALSMVAYYTREYQSYQSAWIIEKLNIQSQEQLNSKQPQPQEQEQEQKQLSSPQLPASVLHLRFRRAVANYLYTMPSYVIYLLTLLMFLLPQQSSQRVLIGATSLAMSTLLAYTMSLALPHSEVSAWPLLGKLYLFNSILLACSLLFSAHIIKLSHVEHDRGVPYWLKQFTLHFLSRIFCVQAIAYTVFSTLSFRLHDEENMNLRFNQIIASEIDPDREFQQQQQQQRRQDSGSDADRATATATATAANVNETVGSGRAGLAIYLKKIYNHVDQLRYSMQRETFLRCVKNEWLLIGTLVDKILFFAYCTVVIVVTVIIFN